MVKSAEKVANVSKKDLDEYFALEERRQSLNRQAKDLEKLQGDLEAKFEAYVRAKGGPEKSITRCGYRVAIILKNGSVAWKEAFLKLAGPKRAEKLVQSTPKKEVLVVEPPASE